MNDKSLCYPQVKANLDRCKTQLAEICRGDRKLAIMSVPPEKTDFDMQFSAAFDELQIYRDTGLSPESFKKAFDETAVLKLSAQCLQTSPDRLRELAAADKDGRVVVMPPVKKNDILWTYCNYPIKSVYYCYVTQVSWVDGFISIHCDRLGSLRPENIGKTVFLTRAEAEAALKGGAE